MTYIGGLHDGALVVVCGLADFLYIIDVGRCERVDTDMFFARDYVFELVFEFCVLCFG